MLYTLGPPTSSDELEKLVHMGSQPSSRERGGVRPFSSLPRMIQQSSFLSCCRHHTSQGRGEEKHGSFVKPLRFLRESTLSGRT